jgi:hypothetical protein
MAVTRRGVKATFASRRTRVCPGGSLLVSVGTGRKPPSVRRCPAAGQIGWSGARVFAAENTWGVWKICRISW